jgi:hypothetical protein
MASKTKTTKLSVWEILAIEEALRNGLPHVEKTSLDALIEKIANAKSVTVKNK